MAVAKELVVFVVVMQALTNRTTGAGSFRKRYVLGRLTFHALLLVAGRSSKCSELFVFVVLLNCDIVHLFSIEYELLRHRDSV